MSDKLSDAVGILRLVAYHPEPLEVAPGIWAAEYHYLELSGSGTALTPDEAEDRAIRVLAMTLLQTHAHLDKLFSDKLDPTKTQRLPTIKLED